MLITKLFICWVLVQISQYYWQSSLILEGLRILTQKGESDDAAAVHWSMNGVIRGHTPTNELMPRHLSHFFESQN